MRKLRSNLPASVPKVPALPGWIMSGPAQTLETAAFLSGAALTHLAGVVGNAVLPQALWRDRLALAAAAVCVNHSGRREGKGALRDALHLTKAGDDPGPAGRMFRQWSRSAAWPISVSNLDRTLEDVPSELIAQCLDAVGRTPVDRSAQVIEAVLTDNPRAEMEALVLADAVLASALGWTHLMPLLALGMTSRDLQSRGDDLRLACHRAAVEGSRQALSVVGDLARGATRLLSIVPKLRAKGAARAVDLFLSRDALAPVALARELHDSLSDRAARRLCERLVELGALRELTGRDTFRLYGV